MQYAEHYPLLLDIARDSIRHGLQRGGQLSVIAEDYPEVLREKRATFVTLKIDGALRGCIGTLEAHRPLVKDIADNAFAAAFRDPRFGRLSEPEFERLHYHISVLTPPEPMQFEDEADLLRQLRPAVDGLVLEDGPFRGTFLPSVWESLPEPVQFLRHLKQKAGLAQQHWSPTVRIRRYTVEDIESEPPRRIPRRA